MVGTLALLLALLLAPLTNIATHGPADGDFQPAMAAGGADADTHSHAQDADPPAHHHDSTDHDHPTFALIPPQQEPASPRLGYTPRPAHPLFGGTERGNLLRPPRALA